MSFIYIIKNCKLCFLYFYDRFLNLCLLLEMYYESIINNKKGIYLFKIMIDYVFLRRYNM